MNFLSIFSFFVSPLPKPSKQRDVRYSIHFDAMNGRIIFGSNHSELTLEFPEMISVNFKCPALDYTHGCGELLMTRGFFSEVSKQRMELWNRSSFRPAAEFLEDDEFHPIIIPFLTLTESPFIPDVDEVS